jgi:hypothetical protein
VSTPPGVHPNPTDNVDAGIVGAPGAGLLDLVNCGHPRWRTPLAGPTDKQNTPGENRGCFVLRDFCSSASAGLSTTAVSVG